LIGGSPCQNFSFAGKRKGMTANKESIEITTLEQYLELKENDFIFDGQSYLFWEYIRILKEVMPKYFLLENVVMEKKWEKIISEILDVEPIMINSSLVSAQNRKRLYWTNIPNIEQPIDKNITWGDVREHGVNNQSYYYTDKALQWLGHVSRDKKKVLKVHHDDEKMQMIEASHHKKYSNQRFFGIVDFPSDEECVGAMRGRYIIDGKRQDGKEKTSGKTKQYIEFRYDGKTNCLTTVSKDNIVVPFTLPNRVPADEFFFRYITPLECERLQTLPDNYTSVVSATQRYKMIGNGWTVDVISHILSNIIV
jgi:DNA (cytosine-5)-methyltransferase 3A